MSELNIRERFIMYPAGCWVMHEVVCLKTMRIIRDVFCASLSRYVHLNPVKVAGVKTKPVEERVSSLRNYRWSSYPGYIDEKRRLEFLDAYRMSPRCIGGSDFVSAECQPWSARRARPAGGTARRAAAF